MTTKSSALETRLMITDAENEPPQRYSALVSSHHHTKENCRFCEQEMLAEHQAQYIRRFGNTISIPVLKETAK